MAMKLSTTLQHINNIPNPINAKIVKEFYEYLKYVGTSENYQNQNIKQIIGFARYLGSGKSFHDVDLMCKRSSDIKFITIISLPSIDTL